MDLDLRINEDISEKSIGVKKFGPGRWHQLHIAQIQLSCSAGVLLSGEKQLDTKGVGGAPWPFCLRNAS